MKFGQYETVIDVTQLPTSAAKSAVDDARSDPFNIMGTDDLFRPLPPIQYTVNQVIPTGSLAVLAGYSASYKSWVALDMTMAVTGGRNFMGRFAATPGGALYLNFENQKSTICRRVQQLAFGRPWFQRATLDVGQLPSVYLNDSSFVPMLAAEIARVPRALVVIDTVRAAMPGLDENSSEVRRGVDALRRVSESSGTSFLLLAHSPKRGASRARSDPREAIRGSSALLDAVDTAFVIQRSDEDGEARLTHIKSRDGREMEEQTVMVVPVGADSVRIGCFPSERAARGRTTESNLEQQVVDVIKKQPGCTQADLITAVGRRADSVRKVLRSLEDSGRIVRTGDKKAYKYNVAESVP